MTDKQILDQFCIEMAKLGFLASLELTTQVFVEKKGKLFFPHMISALHIPEVKNFIPLTKYGREISHRIWYTPREQSKDLALELYQNNIDIKIDALVHVADPQNNNKTIHYMLFNGNYCDAKGKPIKRVMYSKDHVIEKIVFMCWHRILINAGKMQPVTNHTTTPDMWQ